jgi:protein O-GlcNAc transferase
MTVAEAIDVAAAHISSGNYPLADFLCRDVLAVAPGHAIAFNLIGVIAAQLGLHDRAIAHFEMALAGTPPFLPAKDNLQKIRNAQARAPRPQVRTSQQFLLIKAWGYGFWSDVSHVLGCLLLAEITGRTPVTHWDRNSLFRDGSGQDAFRIYFEPLSPFTLDTVLAEGAASFFPTKWSIANLREEHIAKWQGASSRMGGVYFLNRPETVAVSDFYIGVVDLLPWIPPTHTLHGKSLDEVYYYLTTTWLKPGSPSRRGSKNFTEATSMESPPSRRTSAARTKRSRWRISIRSTDFISRRSTAKIHPGRSCCSPMTPGA